MSQDAFYIQGESLRERKGNLLAIHDFIDFLKQRGLKGFVFDPSVKNISQKEIVSFIRLLIGSVRYDNPASWLSQEVKREALGWVEVHETSESSGNLMFDPRENKLNTCSQTGLSEEMQRIGCP
jgi:hypothetical protein